MKFFEVIWQFDQTISPANWKMMVCLYYDEGWFLRINTEDKFRPCVAVSKAENTFLKHDSNVECSLLIIDEYEIEQAMENKGIIGRLSLEHKDDVLERLMGATYISAKNKATLQNLFDGAL